MSTLRTARVQRTTRETDITLALELSEAVPAPSSIHTPVPFLTHMLEALARHGSLSLQVESRGDVEVDAHHTVEDLGLVLGMALDQALGDRAGIMRFGHFTVVMDDAVVDCAVDLGGRSHLIYDLPAIGRRQIGTFDCDLVREFFQALATQARMNLFLQMRAGDNAHHLVEAAFKAFARALRNACAFDPTAGGVPSTKGRL